MTGREIVTLQLGHYANFTGAHWWNIQAASFVYDPKVLQAFPKEVNHDVLFRVGQTLRGDVTFTPRLVALDLKGSLNSLRREGTLYSDNREEDVKWCGDVTLHKSDSGPRNQFLEDLDRAEKGQGVDNGKGDGGNRETSKIGEREETSGEKSVEEPVVFGKRYYNLDEHVNVWSDYLTVHYHPRTIQILKDFILNSEDQPFDVFGLGQQTLHGDAWDEWEDRVRFYTEDCDSLQGFQVLFDSHNSFGGSASRVLSYLKDEFPGKAVLTVPLSPAVLPDQTVIQRATRILNSALCVGHCCPDSSLYLPLSLASSLWRNLGAPRTFPHLAYKSDLAYHSTAVLAATLDTMTLPIRRESSPVGLSDLTAGLSSVGRKVASLHTSLPFPMLEQETFVDTLMSEREEHIWHSLTPGVSPQSSPTSQSCVVRGIPSDRIKRAGASSRHLSSCSSVDDVLQLYLTEAFPHTASAGCVMRDPLKVVSPFPHIFQPCVTRTGLVSSAQRPPKSGVESVPALTSLQCGPAVGQYVSSLHSEASRFKIRRHHHFLEAGLEEEEFVEILDTLCSLADCYGPRS
ncbi:hypothetical protein ACOMHN_006916 [Nucella lapillus]